MNGGGAIEDLEAGNETTQEGIDNAGLGERLTREECRRAMFKRNWLVLLVLAVLSAVALMQVVISMYTDVFLVESISELRNMVSEIIGMMYQYMDDYPPPYYE